MISLFCEGAQLHGHHVTLMANVDSKKFDRLIAHYPPDNTRYISRAYRKLVFQYHSLLAGLKADVVFNFGRTDYLIGLLHTRIPIVCRFANPIQQVYIDWLLFQRRHRLKFISVSDHQRAHIRGGIWTTVHNGTDTHALHFSNQSRGYLAFLGRLSPNKGVDVAIAVAQRANYPLKIAGNVPNEPGAEAFFHDEVAPYLGKNIEWIGEIGDVEKNDFLGGADALLFPITWNDSFANVIIEALACGTPVIASRRACAPEAIELGRTGFLCDTVDEMAAAAARISELDRRTCRDVCVSRFDQSRMVEEYLQVAESLLTNMS